MTPSTGSASIANWPAPQRNIGRFLFLHPAARDLYAYWDNQIRGCVSRMRALAGTDPDAPDLAALVGELLRPGERGKRPRKRS